MEEGPEEGPEETQSGERGSVRGQVGGRGKEAWRGEDRSFLEERTGHPVGPTHGTLHAAAGLGSTAGWRR